MDFFLTLPHLPLERVNGLKKALEGRPTHALLLNEKKMSDECFLSLFPKVTPHPFIKHAFLYEKETYDFGKCILYDLGAYSIQDASSMVSAYALGVNGQDKVLDMCAAPGGKSIFFSLQMDGNGVLLSNDLSYSRAKDLSSNIERMGLGNVVVTADDFCQKGHLFENSFSAILLDAPCSGSSMFRKNPQAKLEWSPKKVSSCQQAQSRLLDQAASMLLPGGRMVYSTCSFSYEENEGQLLNFLSRHPEMEALAIGEQKGFYHPSALPESIYLFPDLFPGEGQFLCLMKKKGGLPEISFPSPRSDKGMSSAIDFYGLEGRDNVCLGESQYSLSRRFDTKTLHLLRYGLKVAEPPFREPSQALAHYLGRAYQYPLSQSQAISFCKGETFLCQLPEGYHLASFEGMGIGFFKVAKGQMKNHYPKGCRRNYGANDLFLKLKEGK